jgi:parallel beta-helix repeat protein
VTGCNDNLIGGNRIEDNGRHGIKLYGWTDPEGVEHPCDNNKVTSNVLDHNKHGVYLMDESENNQIESNSICKNDFGVYFDASTGNPDNNMIQGNLICKNGVGVRMKMSEEPPQNNRVVFNSIYDNKEWGVVAGLFTVANFNWWGTEAEPTVGEDVSENVLFEPWLPWKTIG